MPWRLNGFSRNALDNAKVGRPLLMLEKKRDFPDDRDQLLTRVSLTSLHVIWIGKTNL